MTDEEREIVLYGLESMGGNLLGAILILIIGAGFGCVGDAILLWFWLFPLRKYTGGFHAATRTGCLFVSSGMLFMAFTIFAGFKHTIFFYAVNGIVSGCVIWWFAPVGNPAKGLDESEHVIYQQISRKIMVTEMVIYFLAIYYEWECVIRSIGMTFFIAGISLVAGVINLSGKANFRGRSSE